LAPTSPPTSPSCADAAVSPRRSARSGTTSSSPTTTSSATESPSASSDPTGNASATPSSTAPADFSANSKRSATGSPSKRPNRSKPRPELTRPEPDSPSACSPTKPLLPERGRQHDRDSQDRGPSQSGRLLSDGDTTACRGRAGACRLRRWPVTPLSDLVQVLATGVSRRSVCVLRFMSGSSGAAPAQSHGCGLPVASRTGRRRRFGRRETSGAAAAVGSG
jgi:hypothetical protein